MRRLVLSFLLLFLAVPAASASETKPAEAAVPEVVPRVTADAPADAGLQLTKVQLEERAPAEDAAVAQDMPARGSFWWVVGAIVVAGVILAVVL
jgi:hypothetical protein